MVWTRLVCLTSGWMLLYWYSCIVVKWRENIICLSILYCIIIWIWQHMKNCLLVTISDKFWLWPSTKEHDWYLVMQSKFATMELLDSNKLINPREAISWAKIKPLPSSVVGGHDGHVPVGQLRTGGQGISMFYVCSCCTRIRANVLDLYSLFFLLMHMFLEK